MDSTLKQRLIGAAVLAALAIIFLPMLLKGPDVKEPDAAEVPLSMPATPGQEFETRELPLTTPDAATPPGGVLGLAPAATTAASPTTAVADAASGNDAEPASATAAATPAAATAATPASMPAATPAAAAAPPPAPSAAPANGAKTPVDKAPESAATAAGNYVVNIGSFSNLANANALLGKLRAARLPVVGDKVSLASGTAMRIRVGPYVDRAAAEAARLRAESVTGSSGKVIALDAESAVAAPAAKPAIAPAKVPAAPAPTKAATPAVATPSKAAPVLSGYAVQLSAPSVEADAIALRDRARSQGFSSFVQRVESDAGVRFRVRVGPVADRSAAEAMRDAVNAKLGTKGIVVSNP